MAAPVRGDPHLSPHHPAGRPDPPGADPHAGAGAALGGGGGRSGQSLLIVS